MHQILFRFVLSSLLICGARWCLSFLLSYLSVIIAAFLLVCSIRVLSLFIMCNSERQTSAFVPRMLMCVPCPVQAPTLTMEGGRLKRSLQLLPRRDFETVPEPVWRALYHWYGANLSLPRPVSEHSKPLTS